MLNAALEAAITTVPRLFIADCITMFATENTALWTPAGSPILMILINTFLSKRRLFTSTCITLSVFISFINNITELSAFDITVAIATPFTVIFSTMTKNRFSSTLTTPEKASAFSGVFVSPMLRNIAASKL